MTVEKLIEKAKILIEALPYIRAFSGKTVATMAVPMTINVEAPNPWIALEQTRK